MSNPALRARGELQAAFVLRLKPGKALGTGVSHPGQAPVMSWTCPAACDFFCHLHKLPKSWVFGGREPPKIPEGPEHEVRWCQGRPPCVLPSLAERMVSVFSPKLTPPLPLGSTGPEGHFFPQTGLLVLHGALSGLSSFISLRCCMPPPEDRIKQCDEHLSQVVPSPLPSFPPPGKTEWE